MLEVDVFYEIDVFKIYGVMGGFLVDGFCGWDDGWCVMGR